MIFSFEREAVDTIAQKEPMLPTTWLLDQVPRDPEGIRRALRLALTARVSAVGVSYKKAWPAFIRAAHERGLMVFTWTVNEEKDMRAMIERGVDGVITDRPDVLLDLVRVP